MCKHSSYFSLHLWTNPTKPHFETPTRFLRFTKQKSPKRKPRVRHKVMADATKGTAELEAKQDSDMKAKGCWVSNNKKNIMKIGEIYTPQIIHFNRIFHVFFFRIHFGGTPIFGNTRFTRPETKSKSTPEKWMVGRWNFLLGAKNSLFSGASC